MSTEAHNITTEATEATEVDKINTGALGTLVAVGLFAMITICAAVAALVRHDMDAEQSSKAADANEPVIALKASQRAVLNGPAGYLDRNKGIVSLPIDTAKQVVVSELARDPNSATPAQADSAAPAPAAPAGSSSAAPAGSAQKPEESGKSAEEKKGAGAKPEMGKEQGAVAPKPAPAHPAPPPSSPTAASPGAQAPGPLKN